MKKIIFTIALAISSTTFAQLQSPQLSPIAKIEQTVGLTNVQIEYSRPQKNGRDVFKEVVNDGQIWRTGANKNSILTTDDKLVFGKDTLKPGSYSLFILPEGKEWTLYFYKTTDNWGVPANFDKNNVVLKQQVKTENLSKSVENFTISIDDVTIKGASLNFAWDKTSASYPFIVLTDAKMKSNIDKVLAGPTANDYYRAADYIYNSNGDMKLAYEYMKVAVDKLGDNVGFFHLRKFALIQAANGDYELAIKTAKHSSKLATIAKNEEYVKMNDASIKEWEKKKK